MNKVGENEVDKRNGVIEEVNDQRKEARLVLTWRFKHFTNIVFKENIFKDNLAWYAGETKSFTKPTKDMQSTLENLSRHIHYLS